MKKAIRSRCVYTKEGKQAATLVVEDGAVAAIAPHNAVLPGLPVEDFANLRVVPGIIDVHNHGFRGIDGSTASAAELQAYTRELASVGVTGVLVTTGYEATVRAVDEAMQNPPQGARILGIHCEGPFFSPWQMGVATRGDGTVPAMPNPTPQDIDAIARRCAGHMRYMTIAPETVRDKAVYAALKAHGTVIAGGHTNATYDEYCQGIAAGVQVATHTGNAMRGIGHRDVGALGAVLLSDIYAELIADFVHISPEMIRLMFRIKDPRQFILVSDSTAISGLAPGEYDTEAFGHLTLQEDGRVLTPVGRMAGSSLYVLRGLQNIVERMGIPMETALLMTGQNPATLLGLGKKGALAPGLDADLVVLHDDYTVAATMAEGTWVYREDGI